MCNIFRLFYLFQKSINKLEQKVQVLLWEKTLKMNRLKCIKKERDELVEPAVINHLKLENESFLILNKQYQMMLFVFYQIYLSSIFCIILFYYLSVLLGIMRKK